MSAAIDLVIEQLRALEPALAQDAPHETWSGRSGELMEDTPPTPAWIGRLVEEFAGTQNPEIANSLASTLAAAANDRERARWVAPLAIQAVQALRVASPWPRLNLCTAIYRLLMFGAIGRELGRPIPGLGRLLIESMQGDDLVKATAAQLALKLRYLKMTDALSDADREAVEAAVLACVDSTNEELADYARLLAAER